jgi:hypothetical protein
MIATSSSVLAEAPCRSVGCCAVDEPGLSGALDKVKASIGGDGPVAPFSSQHALPSCIGAGQALTSRGANTDWRQFVGGLRPAPALSAELEYRVALAREEEDVSNRVASVARLTGFGHRSKYTPVMDTRPLPSVDSASLAARVAAAPRVRRRIRFADDQLPAWAVRDALTGSVLPRKCGSYSAGHTVHWIQAIRSARTIDDEENRARLVGVEGELLIVKTRDRYRAYWNHEPERLLEDVGGLGRYVYIDDDWSILAGLYSRFSVRPADEPWNSCPPEPSERVEGPLTAGQVVALVEERGGITIPFDQLDLGED